MREHVSGSFASETMFSNVAKAALLVLLNIYSPLTEAIKLSGQGGERAWLQENADQLSATDMMEPIERVQSLLMTAAAQGSRSIETGMIAQMTQSMKMKIREAHSVQAMVLNTTKAANGPECDKKFARALERPNALRGNLPKRSKNTAKCRKYMDDQYSTLIAGSMAELDGLFQEMQMKCDGSSRGVSPAVCGSCDSRNFDSVGSYFTSQKNLFTSLMQAPSKPKSKDCDEATAKYQERWDFIDKTQKSRENMRRMCRDMQDLMDQDACTQAQERRTACREYARCQGQSATHGAWIQEHKKTCGAGGLRDTLQRQYMGLIRSDCMLSALQTDDPTIHMAACHKQSRADTDLSFLDFHECQVPPHRKPDQCQVAGTCYDEDMSGTAAYEFKYYQGFRPTPCISSCCNARRGPNARPQHRPSSVVRNSAGRPGATGVKRKEMKDGEVNITGPPGSTMEGSHIILTNESISGTHFVPAKNIKGKKLEMGNTRYKFLSSGMWCGKKSFEIFDERGMRSTHLACQKRCDMAPGCSFVLFVTHESSGFTQCKGYTVCRNQYAAEEHAGFITHLFARTDRWHYEPVNRPGRWNPTDGRVTYGDQKGWPALPYNGGSAAGKMASSSSSNSNGVNINIVNWGGVALAAGHAPAPPPKKVPNLKPSPPPPRPTTTKAPEPSRCSAEEEANVVKVALNGKGECAKNEITGGYSWYAEGEVTADSKEDLAARGWGDWVSLALEKLDGARLPKDKKEEGLIPHVAVRNKKFTVWIDSVKQSEATGCPMQKAFLARQYPSGKTVNMMTCVDTSAKLVQFVDADGEDLREAVGSSEAVV
eukprot:TRINITY_DN65573_c0_g1_i1.p1 TRINITY_DN65573_c0_g1~~TRINITY_DN65573_c0_g1_i1.p1  ORF type:complete len:824 (+),score=150.42 TRINITY_DN65573_c0_g1_i1:47-2518(+)